MPIIVCVVMALLMITFSIVAGEKSESTVSSGSIELDTENIASKVFPKDEIVDVRITVDEDQFQDMLDNASAEEYKPASVTYNGIQVDNIGIRTKGNLSLRSVVQMSDSDRYSFKLSFDEYIGGQTLYGISKINLNNNYSDASYMREFLTYELAETMGLPTPGFSYVNVYVNDELWGTYLAIEQISDAYLQRNFGNSDGALYKGEMTGSGSDLQWLGDDVSLYSGLVLKSESSNNDIVVDMINELNNGSDYESVLDVEEALKYVALNVLAVNMDSYLGSNKQNYYLYENNGIFSILPWDYNMAFGGLGGTGILIDEPTQGALAERPLIAKLLAVDEYKELYHTILQQAIDNYLTPDKFNARVQEISELISSSVEKDPSAFYTYDEYQTAVQQLMTFNTTQVESFQQQLDGTIASAGDGSGTAGSSGPGGMGGRGEQNNQDGNATASSAAGMPEAGQAGEAGGPPSDSTNAATGEQQADGSQQGFPGGGRGQGGPGGGQNGGMGGFGGGGFGGGPGGTTDTATAPEGNAQEAAVIGGSLLLMAAAAFFIRRFRYRRL